MKHSDYPRVLILGQAFDQSTGGGITLSNLFKGWPKERLAVIGLIDYLPNLEICEQYYQLGSHDFRLVWPLIHVWPYSNPSGPVDITTLPINSIDSLYKDRQKNKLRKYINDIVMRLGADQVIRPARYTTELHNWIVDFAPDILYTQTASLQIIRLAEKIVGELKLPYVIHMMDDWPSTLYRDKVLAPYLHWRVRKEFSRLLNRSTLQMGISDKMCRVYTERYLKPFLTFHNPIEVNKWMSVSKNNSNTQTPFRLFYSGRIGIANQKSLMDICNEVSELHNEGKELRLDLYTLEYNSDLGKTYERSGCVYVNPPIPYMDMPQALANADTLILPLDFDPTSIRFAQYSMPTKTSEYMASGTPILVYAPDKMAVTDYAEKENWGCVVSKRDSNALKQALVNLMEDQSLRERLGHRAQELAIQNHDSKKVREAFRLAILSAGQKSMSEVNE